MKRLAKALILDWVENERRSHTAMVAAFRYDLEEEELKVDRFIAAREPFLRTPAL